MRSSRPPPSSRLDIPGASWRAPDVCGGQEAAAAEQSFYRFGHTASARKKGMTDDMLAEDIASGVTIQRGVCRFPTEHGCGVQLTARERGRRVG